MTRFYDYFFVLGGLVTTLASQHDEMLLTPIGYWPASCIHGVSAGSHIVNLDDESFMIKDELTKESVVKTRCDRKYLREMKKKHRELQLKLKKDKNVGIVDGDGWQQYTKQESGDTTTGLLGQWTVPIEPEKGDGTLFTFTGLQNIDWVPPENEPSTEFDIIQPVLQYG